MNDQISTQPVTGAAPEPTREQAIDLWLTSVTEDADPSGDAAPATAGNRIECREGCGW